MGEVCTTNFEVLVAYATPIFSGACIAFSKIWEQRYRTVVMVVQ